MRLGLIGRRELTAFRDSKFATKVLNDVVKYRHIYKHKEGNFVKFDFDLYYKTKKNEVLKKDNYLRDLFLDELSEWIREQR